MTATEVNDEVVAWASELRHILTVDHPELDSFSLTMGPWALHVTKGSARVAGPNGLVDITPRLDER